MQLESTTRIRGSRRRGAIAAAFAVVVLATLMGSLAGCVTVPKPSPISSPTATPAAPSVTSTPTPTPATFNKDGTAQENLAAFDAVNRSVLAANPAAQGSDFIDALVAAGFTKADMQLTADKTSINLPAGSIQFSVRIKGSCLVGQNGAGSSGYHSEVTPVLATGNCLVGDTRPINW